MSAAAARATTQHNERTCPLLELVGNDDLRPTFLRTEVWGVVALWRLRRVCRAFRRWAQAELSLLPRVVAIGGQTQLDGTRTVVPDGKASTSSVEALDLSTMRWSVGPRRCVPSLPDPRECRHSVSCSAEGHMVVCGGYDFDHESDNEVCLSTVFQWLPGTGVWSALPDLPASRSEAASVRLPDGRTMLIGGRNDEGVALNSVLVLAADGSAWSDLPPLTTFRSSPAAAVLPDGKVLVAGGTQSDGRWNPDMWSCSSPSRSLNTAELWDPETQRWTALPPMAEQRFAAAACVLSGGRVAVLGGSYTVQANQIIPRHHTFTHFDGEVFDPVTRGWRPLGPAAASPRRRRWIAGRPRPAAGAEMAFEHGNLSIVAVPGGLVLVGVKNNNDCNELYDEESEQWFQLPHPMVHAREGAGLALAPVAAMVAGAAAAASRLLTDSERRKRRGPNSSRGERHSESESESGSESEGESGTALGYS